MSQQTVPSLGNIFREANAANEARQKEAEVNYLLSALAENAITLPKVLSYKVLWNAITAESKIQWCPQAYDKGYGLEDYKYRTLGHLLNFYGSEDALNQRIADIAQTYGPAVDNSTMDIDYLLTPQYLRGLPAIDAEQTETIKTSSEFTALTETCRTHGVYFQPSETDEFFSMSLDLNKPFDLPFVEPEKPKNLLQKIFMPEP